jgi:hypothetical protein
MKRAFYLFIVVLILGASSVVAQSNGIVIKAKFKANKVCSSDSTRNTITYHIRKDILRVDIDGPAANSSIIYQPVSDKIWVLFHVEQVYYSMVGHELVTMTEEVRKQADEFAKSLSEMNENTREQMEMVWPDGNPFMFEDPPYKLIAKKDSLVSQLMCDKYLGEFSNGNRQFLFTSNLKTTGIKEDELEILNAFAQFMGKGVKAISGNMDFTAIRKKENGYPVLMENYSGKSLCNTYWVFQIYRDKLDNKLFQIPLAYGKFENPLGRD